MVGFRADQLGFWCGSQWCKSPTCSSGCGGTSVRDRSGYRLIDG